MDRNKQNEKQSKEGNKYEFQTRFFNSKLDIPEEQESPQEHQSFPEKISGSSINPKTEVKLREFKKNPNETEWYHRYRRGGFLHPSLVEEDEDLFKEHLEALKRKEQFDFNKLDKEEIIKIYFNDKEIDEGNPAKTITDTALHQKVKSNLKKMSYDSLTPIQRCIIPYVLERKDCLGCAQTGSGKTIAFLAPIVTLMLNEGFSKNEQQNSYCSYPICLILVPTRELAEQIYKEVRKVVHQTGIMATKLYGGVPCDAQIRELKQGCDIVIGTPGRTIEHIERKLLYLSMIKYLIIDESDRMLDMGFEDQMKAIVFNNQMTDKSQRNNLMFSATIPHGVLSISQKFMNESYLISSTSKYETGNANSNVEQIFHYVEDNDKISKLHEIFQQIQGNAIVFLETKKSVDNLEHFLERRNYNVCAIHGDKPQQQRQEVIQLFSSGQIPILIATDVVSRGLDFPNVAYVINFDMPKNIEDYIHRIGRTGRVGNKGTSVSFFNEKNASIAKDLYHILNKLKQEIPEWLYEFYDESKGDSYYYREKKSNYRGGGGYQRNNNNNKNYHGGSSTGQNYNKGNYVSNSGNEYGGGGNSFGYGNSREGGNKSYNNNSYSNHNSSNANSYNNNRRNDYESSNSNNNHHDSESSNKQECSKPMFFNSNNKSNEPIFKDLGNQRQSGYDYYK